MRGQKALVHMRRNGVKPAWVFIDTDAGPNALPMFLQWQNVDPTLCDIDVEPSEGLERIDWRPVVGLNVHVSGSDARRVSQVAEKCQAAHAKRVIWSCLQSVSTHPDYPAFRCVSLFDTAGIVGPKDETETIDADAS